MKNHRLTASVLSLGLALAGISALAAGEMCSNGSEPGAVNLCNNTDAVREQQIQPPERSAYLERAFHTRVGTQRAALDPAQRDALCKKGNASREALALRLAQRLDEDGADSITRGNMVERKVMLKLPCA